jgi:hypothetical protein
MATIGGNAGGPLAFAAGKGRPLFYFDLVSSSASWRVSWTSSYSFRAVAIGIAAYQVFLVAAQFVYLESREVGIPLRETSEALGWPPWRAV